MKTIKFTQRIEVIETYEINYGPMEFTLDCVDYNIENFTYEDLCRVMETEEDVMITVYEEHYDNTTREWIEGPCFVNAYDFFTQLMETYSYERGMVDSDPLDLASINVVVLDVEEDSYPS